MKILGCILGVVAFLVVRFWSSDGFKSVVTSATTNTAATCLTMAGSTTREEDGSTYIVGTIRNNCDRQIGHVTIGFKLDRPSGSNVGTKFDRPEAPIFAYSNDVRPHETRTFKTMFAIGKNTTYRFSGITAY